MDPRKEATRRPLPGERLISAVKPNGDGHWIAQVWVVGTRQHWDVTLPKELGKDAAWDFAREMYDHLVQLQDARDQEDPSRMLASHTGLLSAGTCAAPSSASCAWTSSCPC